MDTERIDWSLGGEVIFEAGAPQPGEGRRVRLIPQLWAGRSEAMLPADVTMHVERISVDPVLRAEDAAGWRAWRDFFQWARAKLVINNKIYLDCTLFKLQHSGKWIGEALRIQPQTLFYFELFYGQGPLLRRELPLHVKLMGKLERPLQ